MYLCSNGQKRSSVARIKKVLSERGCMDYTIIVAATASDSAALQFMLLIVVVQWVSIS